MGFPTVLELGKPFGKALEETKMQIHPHGEQQIRENVARNWANGRIN